MKTLFELWVEAGYPTPPFIFYRSPEFEYGIEIDVVIFHQQGHLPTDSTNVSFIPKGDHKNINSSTNGHSIFVEHDRKYIKVL